jgi:hypothetical protein
MRLLVELGAVYEAAKDVYAATALHMAAGRGISRRCGRCRS